MLENLGFKWATGIMKYYINISYNQKNYIFTFTPSHMLSLTHKHPPTHETPKLRNTHKEIFGNPTAPQ